MKYLLFFLLGILTFVLFAYLTWWVMGILVLILGITRYLAEKMKTHHRQHRSHGRAIQKLEP